MIGAMPAVAVRHERVQRGNKMAAGVGGGLVATTSRDQLLGNGILHAQNGRRVSRPARPNHLPLKVSCSSFVFFCFVLCFAS